MENTQNSAPIPLNIETFNKLTHDNLAAKEDIINLFILNTSECIRLMERSSNDNIWLSVLKEINSLANCVGAEQIGKTCSVAKTIYMDSYDTKKKVCSNLSAKLENLKVFVRNTGY